MDKCIRAIEHRGLDAEGLYRISPRLQTVQNLVHRIEIDEEQFEFAATEEVYTIAAILKLYLRRLPEPLFRWSLEERIAFSKARDEHIRNGFIVLRTKLKRQPPIHVATLKGRCPRLPSLPGLLSLLTLTFLCSQSTALAEHLSMVVLADNKMDARNLSIICTYPPDGQHVFPAQVLTRASVPSSFSLVHHLWRERCDRRQRPSYDAERKGSSFSSAGIAFRLLIF